MKSFVIMYFSSPRFLRAVVLLGLAAATPCLHAAEPPALVVVISIDQFRADYLARFRQHFSPGGFNLLLDQGANFVDCHFRHSFTKTGPGHAVMLTGVHANLNGIIGNDWIDRDTFAQVSCVGDPGVQVLGLPPSALPRRLPASCACARCGDNAGQTDALRRARIAIAVARMNAGSGGSGPPDQARKPLPRAWLARESWAE